MRSRICFWLALIIMGLAGCSGGSVSSHSSMPLPTPAPTPSPVSSPTPPSATHTADHVVLVVLENHSFSQVIGSALMPYLNSLASQHSLAANYFGNTHPSIGNYFMLTTGQIVANDDGFTGTVSDDNLVRALMGAGKSWKAYMESLPAPGYTGNDVLPYVKHHDPFTYFTDVLNSVAQTANIVPLSQFAADLGSGSLPSFAFVIPNIQNDAHDCPGSAPACADSDKLAAADNWLKVNLDPLINSPAFANGVLIITWDESDTADLAHGGGQVATVLVGAHVKSGFQSTAFYQHPSTLRLILDLLQVGDHPGASATAPGMGEFFQ